MQTSPREIGTSEQSLKYHKSDPSSGGSGGSRMAASVAILPSAPLGSSHEHSFEPNAPFASTVSESSSRPKLSLNTSIPQNPVSKGNTGLRLDTLSAISPTVRNTYKNTYEERGFPATPFEASGSSQSTRSIPLKPLTPHPSHTSTALPTSRGSNLPTLSESTSSSCSLSPSSPGTPPIPYKASTELSSILRNSPFSSRNVQDGSSPSSRPKPKQPEIHVAFRQPLDEEITTSRYTASHLDLIDPEPLSTSSSGSGSSPRTGKKRDSPSDEEDESNEERDEGGSVPKTPVAGRRKRRRAWVWTLGPVPGQSGGGEVDASESVAIDGL
ncbi:MAG: hypothetical protein M1831_002259 [Alyxoria varia]|nr:MAG: hypothetical protein M1831_002259 [Alyxoria varia]